MGPTILFDKSFLESLNVDESCWFDHFFLANVCPSFYIETHGDLAKEPSSRGSGDDLVQRLAEKFPDWAGSPNVHHRTMLTGNLMGEDVPLRAQVIFPPGYQAEVEGNKIVMFRESEEAKAFHRWVRREFGEEERRAAAEWRNSSYGYDTKEVLEVLVRAKVFEYTPCPTLDDVRDQTDQVMRHLTDEQKIWLANQILKVFESHHSAILERWAQLGKPSFDAFAPYAAYALRVELFYHIAVHASRLNASHRMDFTYLFYLPFCNAFVSSDRRSHQQCAQYFLRDDQEFIWGPDLKAALRDLDTRYSALPDEVREQSVFQIAPEPPQDGENLVTKLWIKYPSCWKSPRTPNLDEAMELTSQWKDRIKTVQEMQTSGMPSTLSDAPLGAMIMRRSACTWRGKWWRVPKELRKKKNPQNFNLKGITVPELDGKEIEVGIRQGSNVDILTGCRTELKDGRLYVKFDPASKDGFCVIAPDRAMISWHMGRLAIFTDAETDLGRAVVRYFIYMKKQKRKSLKKRKK